MHRAAFLGATGSLLAASTLAARAQTPPVTVFAAASLREAFEAAGPAFSSASGYAVRFSFGGSDTLAAQLLAGAPADVFAAANELQMQRAASGGAVGAARTLARNHLVVVVPPASEIRSIGDLARPGTKLVLAAPTVPAGVYARRAFAALGTTVATQIESNVVSEETDVKAVLTKIELGEGDAGVAYATDITPRVRAIQFPPKAAPEAVYPIAVTTKPPNPAGAAAFVAFITSRQGRRFLTARGFL